MSDLFHEQVPDEFIVNVGRVMRLANWHTYQVLTKRSRADAGFVKREVAVRIKSKKYLVGSQHAEPVLLKLKREGIIELDFGVPDVRRLDSPRSIHMRTQKHV